MIEKYFLIIDNPLNNYHFIDYTHKQTADN